MLGLPMTTFEVMNTENIGNLDSNPINRPRNYYYWHNIPNISVFFKNL
jgi:hypothetical protein